MSRSDDSGTCVPPGVLPVFQLRDSHGRDAPGLEFGHFRIRQGPTPVSLFQTVSLPE